VGVPVIGFCGEHFASRVSASCLTAIGAQELITPDLAAYEALALRLARDPPALAALKAKLAANRMTQPLFDTPRFARDLERAYAEMWRLYQAGEAPRPITWPLM
jgi:predicted O-linked N-acetylglucosamine transferase (SPINDLY family)